MFEEPLIPRQRPVSLFFHVLRNEGVELFAIGTILFVLEVPRQFASYYFHQVLWRFSLREPTRVIPQLKCIPQIIMIAQIFSISIGIIRQKETSINLPVVMAPTYHAQFRHKLLVCRVFLNCPFCLRRTRRLLVKRLRIRGEAE